MADLGNMFHIISDKDMYIIMQCDNYIVIQGCSSWNCILAFYIMAEDRNILIN